MPVVPCLEVLADATSSQVVSLTIEEHTDQWVSTGIPEVPITIPSSIPKTPYSLEQSEWWICLKSQGLHGTSCMAFLHGSL